MTDHTTRPDPAIGWGESLPLPLTEAGTGSGESGHTRKAVRRDDGGGGPEVGGPHGPEPTRYNDWERKGRCSDF